MQTFSFFFVFFVCFCLVFEGLHSSFATKGEMNDYRWPFREERRGYFLKTPQRGFKAGEVNFVANKTTELPRPGAKKKSPTIHELIIIVVLDGHRLVSCFNLNETRLRRRDASSRLAFSSPSSRW